MRDWYLGIIGTVLIGLLSWSSLSIISIKTDVALIKQHIDNGTKNVAEKVDNIKDKNDFLTVKYDDLLIVQTDQGKRIVRIETLLDSYNRMR